MTYWFCTYELNGKISNGVSDTHPMDQRCEKKEWTNEHGPHGNSNLHILWATEITYAQYDRYRQAEVVEINQRFE